MSYVIIIFLSFALSISGSIFTLRILDKANFKQKNFLGIDIITSSGLLFVFFLLFYGVFLAFFEKAVMLPGWPLTLLIISFSMAILGLADDLFGERGVGGFKGHFGELLKGKVTTGLIKAVLGFIFSLVVAFLISPKILDVVVNSLILALSINFFNLLDLRPGRSIKAFIIAFILIFAFGRLTNLFFASLPILAPVLVLLYLDLKMKAMLGDAGSNVLGALAGLYIVYSFALKASLAVLLGLIMVHLYSEKHSISKFISSNQVLSWIDGLGITKSKKA